MPVDNRDLDKLLNKAVELQAPKKPLKFSLWKRLKIGIKLWWILFKGKYK